MSDLSRLLGQLAGEGSFDSSGKFSTASGKVAGRYRTFVDQEPAYPALALIQMGHLLGARRFHLSLGSDFMTLRFECHHFPESAWGALEAAGRGELSAQWSHLSRGFWSSLALPAADVSLSLRDPGRGYEVGFLDGSLHGGSAPAGVTSLEWKVRLHPRLLSRVLWAMRQRMAWLNSLERRTAFFPGQIVVDRHPLRYTGDAQVTESQCQQYVAVSLVEQDGFSVWPPYAYRPELVGWTGMRRVVGNADSHQTRAYYFHEERLAEASVKNRVGEIRNDFTEAGEICLVQDRRGGRVITLENCSDFLRPVRNFARFQALPLGVDLAVWKGRGREKARIYLLTDGILGDSLTSPKLPPGVMVVAIAPAGLSYDLSGWNPVMDPALENFLELLTLRVLTLLYSAEETLG